MPKLEIVIPAAGLGRRMKSYGPKALVPVGPEPLIVRQVRLLTAAHPGARLTVVAGFEADRVRRALPVGVRVLVNPDYAETNVARSLQLGVAAVHRNRPVLLVYGDLAFGPEALAAMPRTESAVLIDTAPGRESEVGVNVVDGRAVHFSYGLETRWAQIAILMPHEKRLFLAACRRPGSERLFGFELLNAVLEAGGEFRAVAPPGLRLVEVDTSRDIDRAAAAFGTELTGAGAAGTILQAS
jgi:choline kinase